MRLEQTIRADRPTQGKLTLTNPTERPAQIRLSAGPYRFMGPQGGLPSAQDWLSFTPETLTLAPGQTTHIRYTVTPPPQVAQGSSAEYLCAVLIDHIPESSGSDLRSDPSDSQGSSKITIVPRLALPVYLKIHGRERIHVVIQDLEVLAHLPGAQNAPALLEVRTTLENRGSVHVRPSGSLALFQSNGSILRARPLGKSVPLLPSATLKIPAHFRLPAPGKYKAVVTVDTEEMGLVQQEISFVVTAENKVLSD